jgi:hypothetical protein
MNQLIRTAEFFNAVLDQCGTLSPKTSAEVLKLTRRALRQAKRHVRRSNPQIKGFAKRGGAK